MWGKIVRKKLGNGSWKKPVKRWVWRMLLDNPARHYQNHKLVSSRALRPLNSSRPLPYGERKASQSNVCFKNYVEGEEVRGIEKKVMDGRVIYGGSNGEIGGGGNSFVLEEAREEEVEVLDFSQWHIHALIRNESSRKEWCWTRFYGHPNTGKRSQS